MLDKRQRAYLEAMGIDVWVRREPVAPEPVAAEPAAVAGQAVEPAPAVPEPGSEPQAPVETPKPSVRQSGASESIAPEPPVSPEPEQEAPWVFEAEQAPPPEWMAESEPLSEPPFQEPEPAPTLDWPGLRSAVGECSRCPELVRNRTRTVFGVGDQNADWLVIGEAPGADEDRRGEPFVGRAGQLLNNMLRAIGLGREQVYIANILKCRPPRNRDPSPEEAEACRPFLQRQIELIRPNIILVVGRIAAQNLLETNQPLGRLRGSVHRHGATGTPVVVTYHPAYLLRSPQEKRKAWNDLRLAVTTAAKGAGDEGE